MARIFQFIHHHNEFCPFELDHQTEVSANRSNVKDRHCDELVVWGGVVANCGEDQLSQIVDSNRDCLRSITYCPETTKGGCLVRPKYHQRDRGGKEVFPQLTDMTIRLEPTLLPEDYGWITPNLQRLRLLAVTSARCQELKVRIQSLRKWLKTGDGTFSEELLKACPNLESITVAFASIAEEDRREIDWIQLLPPQIVPWSVHRLILLAVLKPQHELTSEGSMASPMSILNIQLANAVLGFLGRPAWVLKQNIIDPSEAERLQILPNVCGANVHDIVLCTTNEW